MARILQILITLPVAVAALAARLVGSLLNENPRAPPPREVGCRSTTSFRSGDHQPNTLFLVKPGLLMGEPHA